MALRGQGFNIFQNHDTYRQIAFPRNAPTCMPTAHVSHSVHVCTIGCYYLYEILANLMNKSQSAIEHCSSLTANYLKHFAYIFPLCECPIVFLTHLPVWVS